MPAHINRHAPQQNWTARLRRKLGADPEPFPSLSSLRHTQRKIVGQILALQQGVAANKLARTEGRSQGPRD